MATTRRRPTHPFAGARKMKPTLKHRPAIWECMLGTVYARNARGEVKYFDYDWDGAREFAGVALEGADPRVYRAPMNTSSGGAMVPPGAGIRKGQKVLYVRKDA